MRRLLTIGLFSVCFAVAAYGGDLTFDLHPGKLRLRACGDRIIRVTVTPGDRFSDRPSLSVIKAWPSSSGKVQGNSLIAKNLRVSFDPKTKRLQIFDAKGQVLLAETVTGQRSFRPVTAAGERAYAIEQRYDLPKNQAFYGLGCHQRLDFNLRGLTLNLVQDNTIDVNPLLVSTGGYGILWDNASASKVSLGGDTMLVPAARLYSKDQKPGGLSATYFEDKTFTQAGKTATEGPIDFTYTGKDNFSVRWEGYIKTNEAGEYRFSTEADDGTRLWVNGRQLIDDWRDKAVSTAEGKISLPANALVPIRLEYYQNLYNAVVRFKWTPPKRGGQLQFQSEFADQIDYYVLAGPELDDVIRGYREATGQAPMFGKWAYGFWQCKERYQSQQELLDIASGYRSRKIPLDNLVQDWYYWNPLPWGSHEFDPKRYPDPAAAIKALHDMNVHLMISVWAKFAKGSDNYREMEGKGLLYPAAADWGGEDLRYYDAFSPLGRETYWSEMRKKLFSKGIDAWWLDATEPEISMEKFREFKTALGPGARVLNAYSLKTTEAVYQGQRKATTDKRVFILTRSVFAGQQRNGAATWSGDIDGNWDVFRRQVAGGLNFTMAGVPYWCTDIGGFFSRSENDPAYRELFTRWFEWGTFNPIFRVHGTGANKELWRFGPEIQKTLTKYDDLRYRLMPYIYSLAWRVTDDGYTMMRGLPMDFRADSATWDIPDQLMFGPSLLVSPVVNQGATSRSVYLPKGAKWFDFWTGKPLAGGRAIQVEAPLDVLPLHVRAGSILPMGPFLQYTSEKPADPIDLRIYPGADGTFTLYEDQGDGYAYEKGVRATISFAWNDRTKTLTIGDRKGSFPGMLKTRTFRIEVVRPGHGVGLHPEARADATVRYAGQRVQVKI